MKAHDSVLMAAYRQPFAVQSNKARQYASTVAALASEGFLTTKERRGVYGRLWRITRKGLQHLHEEEIL